MGDAEVTAERGGVRRWPRTAAIAAALAVALAVTVAIAYRVLAPTEVVTPARADYPPPPTVGPGVVARLSVAPLIVDGRLRLYAAARQVRADGPVNAKAQVTPYWSYRRWPQQLVGVVADGSTVLTRWSDGRLVALDARTGRPTWRTAGPPPQSGTYAGRRTGALTVYAAPGLHTAVARDGRAVAVVEGDRGARGFDLRTGGELWRADGTCPPEGFTTRAGEYVTLDPCASPRTLRFREVTTGRVLRDWRPDGTDPELGVQPVGCAVARSACPAARTTSGGATRGWLLDGAAPLAATALDEPETWLVGDAAVRLSPDGAELTGRSARTGAELWRQSLPAAADTPVGAEPTRLIAAQPGRVHLLTPGRDLITIDPATGAQRSQFVLRTGQEKTNWAPGFVYASDGFIAVERLTEPVDPTAKDAEYYRSAETIIFGAT
ncbi:PQQ-binding-like beta-propeller repeat protein [Micromonospora sp. NPDC049679]|uniref:outer membrane protein assembly factor BamB family protein n=1 Tax=Micromonospora sp. NPDC049679 TaxID=3155920 RepID=UPI0033FE5D20